MFNDKDENKSRQLFKNHPLRLVAPIGNSSKSNKTACSENI